MSKLFILLLIFILTSIPIYPETIFSLGTIVVGEKQIIKDQNTYPPKKSHISSSNSFFSTGIKSKAENEKFSHNLDLSILTSLVNSESIKFFPGENANFEVHYKKIDFTLGRKIQKFSYLVPNNKDGLEGIGLGYKFSDKILLEVNILDFYRGFPLLENSLLYVSKEKENLKGNRFRQGIHFWYKGEEFFNHFYFQYINLGDWGESSKDNITNSPLSNRDFIYSPGFEFIFKKSFFKTGFGLFLSKGMDKTISHSVRKNSSLIINGELITGNLGFLFSFFEFNYNFFLPDRDKRNEALEVLETGYIGMGSNPGKGKIISQIINYFPSGWITPEGMERSKSIKYGRESAFFQEAEINLNFSNWKLGFFVDHYTPYRIAPSSGKIETNRREFSRLYLVEGGVNILLGSKEINSYFLELSISAFNSSKEIGIKSSMGYLSGGIYF
ncbi:MAG: hypothetical protein KDK36_22015 [Leptospiraceae bacterium]|nr:hypothetical protein [Leptospiraceae bacterium]